MELRVGFDEELMKRYDDRGSPPLIDIHWCQDGVAYPADDWIDFGSVILGWWLTAARRLIEGSPEESLPLMDGPYALIVRRKPDGFQVSARGSRIKWEVQMEQFVRELIQGAEAVRRELQRLGIAEQECRSLEKGVRVLEETIQQRNGTS